MAMMPGGTIGGMSEQSFVDLIDRRFAGVVAGRITEYNNSDGFHPPGRMQATQNGEAGCADVPHRDDPPPGPDIGCSMDSCLKSSSARVNVADNERARKVRIRTAREQEELNMVE